MDETTDQTLGYLFVLAGVGGYAWLWLGSLQVFRRRTWSCVPGTVLRSQVVRRTGPDDPRTATYEARIEYEYAVGDRTLRGRTICSRGGELDAPLRQRFHGMIDHVFRLFDSDWETVSYVFLARHTHLKQITRHLGNPYVAFRTVIAQKMRQGRIPSQDVDVAASLVTGAIIQVIDMRILGYIKGPLAGHTDQVTEACVAIIQG